MKRFFLFTILCMTIALSHSYAQQNTKQYKVYRVKGSVLVQEGNKRKAVETNMNLTKNNVIITNGNTELVLIDTQSKTQFTCKNSGASSISVEKLLLASTTETKPLTEKFFAYLINRMTSKEVGYADDVTASLEREMSNSVFDTTNNDSITSTKPDSIGSVTDSIASNHVVSDSIK